MIGRRRFHVHVAVRDVEKRRDLRLNGIAMGGELRFLRDDRDVDIGDLAVHFDHDSFRLGEKVR